MASDRLLDLMKQGFMKPRPDKKPKVEQPTVACDRCQNWHRKGKHTVDAATGKLASQYRERAKAERAAGGSCHIDTGLPSVSIVMSNGEEFYYQEHQADDVLDEAKKTLEETGLGSLVSMPDYLLAVYQNA